MFAHSDIKSFTAGAIGHGSTGCTGDWKLVQGLDCVGFSVTACTSWSRLPSSSSTFLTTGIVGQGDSFNWNCRYYHMEH